MTFYIILEILSVASTCFAVGWLFWRRSHNTEGEDILNLGREFVSTQPRHGSQLVPDIRQVEKMFSIWGRDITDIRCIRADGVCLSTEDLRIITDLVKKLPQCVYVDLYYAYIIRDDPDAQACIRELLARPNLYLDIRKTGFSAIDAGPFIQSLSDDELGRLLFIPTKVLPKEGWYIVVGDFTDRDACMRRVQIIKDCHQRKIPYNYR